MSNVKTQFLPGLDDSPAQWSDEEIKSILALVLVMSKSSDMTAETSCRLASFFMDALSQVPEGAISAFRQTAESQNLFAALFAAARDCTRATRTHGAAIPNVLIGFCIPGAEVTQPLPSRIGALL